MKLTTHTQRRRIQYPTRLSGNYEAIIAIIVLVCLATCRILIAAWYLATIIQFPCVQSKAFLSWTAFAGIILIEAFTTIWVAVYGLIGQCRSDVDSLKYVIRWLFWQLIVSLLLIAYAVMIITNYDAIAEGYLLCSSLPAGQLFIELVAERLAYLAYTLLGYGVCSTCFTSIFLRIRISLIRRKKYDAEEDGIVEEKGDDMIEEDECEDVNVENKGEDVIGEEKDEGVIVEEKDEDVIVEEKHEDVIVEGNSVDHRIWKLASFLCGRRES